MFWTIFLNNAAFFTAGNKNYLTGADTVLSIDGLTKAETAFLDQMDADGKPIGIMPAVVLVPTALERHRHACSTRAWRSATPPPAPSTRWPTRTRASSAPRSAATWPTASYTGNSAKAWYLLADPGDLPVIEVAFLNGQESPTIETAEADFNVLGVQMRGYHDFGVALQDPKGGVRARARRKPPVAVELQRPGPATDTADDNRQEMRHGNVRA